MRNETNCSNSTPSGIFLIRKAHRILFTCPSLDNSLVFIQSSCIPFGRWIRSQTYRTDFIGGRIVNVAVRKNVRVSQACAQPSDEPRNGEGKEELPSYIQNYESWRYPRWQKHLVYQASTKDMTKTSQKSQGMTNIKREVLKRICAMVVFLFLGTLGYGYHRLNRYVRVVAQTTLKESLDRDVRMGRVVRFNPLTGIRILQFSIPESEHQKTAPVVKADYLDIFLTGAINSITRRKPLKLNATLHNPTIKVSQFVVTGRNGLPTSEWDPGLPSKTASLPPNKEKLSIFEDILQYVQPGRLTVKNANIFMQPADFLDYGHGSEVVEVNSANAEATFPHFSVAPDAPNPIQMDGKFFAKVAGVPVDGRKIELECFCDGNTLPTLKPEDVAVTLRVVGEQVRANHVASFLSLPFRADKGKCSADIEMDFLYRSESLVPIMRGQAQLDTVGLRFHPDPMTPEFHDISGRLKFEGKTLFFDGPVGSLGTLPMTVVGNIHLEDGYNMIGYASPVDVNNILDTFEVEKFVPIQGQATGEVQIVGSLEEPIIRGWAQSSNDNVVFDRLPLESADLSFEWDSIAGLLKFTDINAAVKGGGNVRGAGTMFFDMTKESPYDIRRTEHSERNPKSRYWNDIADEDSLQILPDLPEDPIEIDEYAAVRPYDSMRFDFKLDNVKGGDLLNYYGGEYGEKAVLSLGRVSGEAIIAGDLKDANCRAIWKTVSPPPKVFTNENEDQSQEETTEPLASNTNEDNTKNISEQSEYENKSDKPISKRVDEEPAPNSLSGGDFKGLVYLKLGDPQEARRVKVRTTVNDFDFRRAGWSDLEIQKFLKQVPLMQLNGDSYFKGLMFQRPILPPGTKKMPRTPAMQLLGMDGALAIKNLGLNGLTFENIMTGSFSFSATDFSLSLREVLPDNHPEEHLGSESGQSNRDEVTISASLKGSASLILKRGESSLVASLALDKKGRQTASLFSKEFDVQELLGKDVGFSGGETISGKVDANLNLDVSRRKGEGNLTVKNPGLGQLKFDSISGKMVWNDKNINLIRGLVQFKRSEYQINARYRLSDRPGAPFGWEVDMNIPNADFKEVAKLLQSGNAVAVSMQESTSEDDQYSNDHSGGPFWIKKLAQSQRLAKENMIESWSVPQHLPFSKQMEWFMQYKEEVENLNLQAKENISRKSVPVVPNFSDISGNISGRITFMYKSVQRDTKQASSSTKLFLKAFLDQLAKTQFSFYLVGNDWSLGGVPVDEVLASGSFEDGTLNLGPIRVASKNGSGAVLQGQITKGGQVEGTARVERAPLNLLDLYHNAPVSIKGTCSGRFDVDGNLSNPRAIGRAVWTDAALNGKKVRGAKTDMACVNGRCALTVNADVGGQSVNSEESDDEALRSLNWSDKVVQGLYELAARADQRSNDLSSNSYRDGRSQRDVDSIHVHISAPVRFYLLNYLRKRTPSAFKQEVEDIMTSSYPFDDEWISMDVNVKKYGLAVLSILAPELGWEGGTSDVNMTVSGSLPMPIIKGSISLSDGRMWPNMISQPLSNLRGNVFFKESGLVSLQSVSGRCRGKNINLNGNMFLSRNHRDSISRTLSEYQQLLSTTRTSSNRTMRKLLLTKLTQARTTLNRGAKGLVFDVGGIPIAIPKIINTTLSGRLNVKGTLSSPQLSGTINLSDGIIMLSGANSFPKAKEILEESEELLVESIDGEGIPGNLTYQKDKDPDSKFQETEGIEDEVENKVSTSPTQVKEFEELDLEEANEVSLKDLKVVLGKEMKVAQPFLLNINTSGSLLLNGNANTPNIDGEIRLLRGTLNLFASRMKLRRSELSYLKFDSKQSTNESTGKEKEPVVRMAVENESMIIKIRECPVSDWANNVNIVTKQGSGMNEINWKDITRIDLTKVKSRYLLKKLFANYVVDSLSVNGKISHLDWKVYPSMMTKTTGFGYLNLREELGAGAQLKLGPISVSGTRSLDGVSEASASLRIFNWVSLQLKLKGNKIQPYITFLPKRRISKIYEYTEIQTAEEGTDENGNPRISKEKSERVIAADEAEEDLPRPIGQHDIDEDLLGEQFSASKDLDVEDDKFSIDHIEGINIFGKIK